MKRHVERAQQAQNASLTGIIRRPAAPGTTVWREKQTVRYVRQGPYAPQPARVLRPVLQEHIPTGMRDSRRVSIVPPDPTAQIPRKFCKKSFVSQHNKTNIKTCVPSEDSDQPGHLHSLSDQSSRCALWVGMDPNLLQIDSKDYDQTGWMLMLI